MDAVASSIPEEITNVTGSGSIFLVDVTTERLRKIGELFDSGALKTNVGAVLSLEQARAAHEMFGGAPHARGEIVLNVAA